MSGSQASGLRPGPVHRGKALRFLREYRGLTQRRLASLSGANKASVSDYERGIREIGAANLDRLLRGLEISPRAWESTVRHMEWLAWLDVRNQEPAVSFAELGKRIAELFGRHREQEVSLYLEILEAVTRGHPGRSEDDPE